MFSKLIAVALALTLVSGTADAQGSQHYEYPPPPVPEKPFDPLGATKGSSYAQAVDPAPDLLQQVFNYFFTGNTEYKSTDSGSVTITDRATCQVDIKGVGSAPIQPPPGSPLMVKRYYFDNVIANTTKIDSSGMFDVEGVPFLVRQWQNGPKGEGLGERFYMHEDRERFMRGWRILEKMCHFKKAVIPF
jgi:hypothetical protein